jgi:diphthamide biosynthesis enzyme Dph1/Dph2-like protein
LRIDLLKRGYTNVIVPQSRPLSPGEGKQQFTPWLFVHPAFHDLAARFIFVLILSSYLFHPVLGCTAPSILSTPNTTSNTAPSPLPVLLYVGDGRFHLEAIMIANPRSPAYRYDPYAKAFTRETYDHAMMRELRALAIRRAAGDTRRDCNQGDGACGRRFGLILGTLGRQGSRKVAEHLKRLITGELYEQQEGSNTKDTLANTSASTNTTRMEDPVRSNSTRSSVLTVLMSEITPEKLRAFGDCFDAWVQTVRT